MNLAKTERKVLELEKDIASMVYELKKFLHKSIKLLIEVADEHTEIAVRKDSYFHPRPDRKEHGDLYKKEKKLLKQALDLIKKRESTEGPISDDVKGYVTSILQDIIEKHVDIYVSIGRIDVFVGEEINETKNLNSEMDKFVKEVRERYKDIPVQHLENQDDAWIANYESANLATYKNLLAEEKTEVKLVKNLNVELGVLPGRIGYLFRILNGQHSDIIHLSYPEFDNKLRKRLISNVKDVYRNIRHCVKEQKALARLVEDKDQNVVDLLKHLSD